MEQWRKDSRKEAVVTDLEALVPKDHLLRKVEKVMDYEWLYEKLDPYYCHDNGRPSIDPIVLIKMALIQHLFGIPSLRQTYRDIIVNLAYRWFLGYGLLEHILNKALNNRMVDPRTVFIDGTHIKASANKKKYQKEQVAKAAKVYAEQLREEVNAEREKLGKKPINDDDDHDDEGTSGGGMVEKTVSTTDPDAGMFIKGEHERQFAYEAHTACDRRGFILGVEVTAGNIHDSVAWDALYDEITAKFEHAKYVAMDAAYKTPWIAKKILEDGRIPIMPYTRYKGDKERYKPWEYEYDPVTDSFICPQGGVLRHTTTDKEGKRTYRTTPSKCKSCPCKFKCGANEKGQKAMTTHIWQEYLDIVEAIRKTEKGKKIYAQRKETIERVFADAKEKHAMRYTHHRGLAAVTRWVRLKYAAMNLKKLAKWSWENSILRIIFAVIPQTMTRTPVFAQ